MALMRPICCFYNWPNLAVKGTRRPLAVLKAGIESGSVASDKFIKRRALIFTLGFLRSGRTLQADSAEPRGRIQRPLRTDCPSQATPREWAEAIRAGYFAANTYAIKEQAFFERAYAFIRLCLH